MSLRTLSARYAGALLDVAVKESDPQKVEQDLASIVDALTAHDEAWRVLGNPALPPATRRNIVDAIARKAEAAAPVAKLMLMLADRGRLEILPHLLESYRERLRAHRNIVRASVVSAAPLSPANVAALEGRLAALTGKQVQVEVSTDPSLIGGVVARIGSTVYDGSVKTQLAKMKQQLVEKA